MCHFLIRGVDSGLRRPDSSSGSADRADCTIGSNTIPLKADGALHGFSLKSSVQERRRSLDRDRSLQKEIE